MSQQSTAVTGKALEKAKKKIIDAVNQQHVLSGTYAVENLNLKRGTIEIHAATYGGSGYYRLTPSGSYVCYDLKNPVRKPTGNPDSWGSQRYADALHYGQSIQLRMIVEAALPEMRDKLWPLSAEERLENNIVSDIAQATGVYYKHVYVAVSKAPKVEVKVHISSTKIRMTDKGTFFRNIAYWQDEKDLRYIANNMRPGFRDMAVKIGEVLANRHPELGAMLWQLRTKRRPTPERSQINSKARRSVTRKNAL